MDRVDQQQLAKTLFNGVWTELASGSRTPADDDRMLHMAHSSCYHWGEVGAPENLARGEWQCSRVYATLHRAEPALHHAQRALDLCTENGISGWDVAFCHEALARAHAVAGHIDAARAEIQRARAVPIADAETRELLDTDLATISAAAGDRWS